MTERVPVEPTVLRWARESAGLDADAAARKLAVSKATLEKWEDDELDPTIRQLRKAAKCYRRPLAVLLLPEPPEDFAAMRDFRRVTGTDAGAWSPALHAEFKRALSQREVFLEISELAPDAVAATPEVLRIPEGTDVERAGPLLRDALRIDELQFDQAQPREALNALVGAAEGLGVIVIQTKGIDPDEMKGFSISEWPFPVIALNGTDWPRAKLFSLLHELCHIGLNVGGLCDLHEARRRRKTEDEVEHYCNAVAGAALIPKDQLLADPVVANADEDHQWTLDDLRDLSRSYGASSEAVLLRLVSLGRAHWDLYRTRKTDLDREYREARDRERQRQREATGGPSFYIVKARDLGHGYVAGVLSAFDARAISSLDVADYLEVRYDQLPKLQEVIRR